MSDRPKLCGSCGKLMGVGRVCPYCGADAHSVSVALQRMARQAGGGGGLTATAFLVSLNVFFFVVAIALGGVSTGGGLMDFLAPSTEVLFRFGVLYGPAVDAGQWWRLVMPIFLHFGLLHVAFNSWIGWDAGRYLEQDFGSRLLFLVYVLTGVAGFVASWLTGGASFTAGASGSVSGLLGCLIVRRRMVDGHFSHPVTRSVIRLVVLNAVFGLVVPAVNNTAHLGGFVSGGFFGWLFSSWALGRSGALAVMLATWATFAATVASIVLMAISLFAGGPAQLEAATQCWIVVETAADAELDGDEARRAAACLDEMPGLEAPADAAREAARGALRDARSASQDGDVGRAQVATAAARGAVASFAVWFHEAAPRYGLAPAGAGRGLGSGQ